MLVADTTAIVHLYVAGDCHAAARAAYRRDSDWLTAPLWRYEFVNVLWKIQRAGHCDAEAAAANFQVAAERLVPRERAPSDLEALELALRYKISAYDAYFVTLARELKLPLLTQDRELLAKFPEQAVSLEAFGQGFRR
jgi:predicted nucleic acid-binding protein